MHAPLPWLRLPCALLLSAGLGACAGSVVPTEVRFPSLKPSPDPVQLLDSRPRQAHEYREEARRHTYKFLADDAMQPNPVELVAARIAAALPKEEQGSRIELRRLDIGFAIAPRPLLPTASDTNLGLSSTTPAAAIAAGLLVAYAMISAFNPARADDSGVAYIEVWIGADALRTAQTVAITRNIGAAQAVEAALASALDDLADQARGLKSGARSMR